MACKVTPSGDYLDAGDYVAALEAVAEAARAFLEHVRATAGQFPDEAWRDKRRALDNALARLDSVK